LVLSDIIRVVRYLTGVFTLLDQRLRVLLDDITDRCLPFVFALIICTGPSVVIVSIVGSDTLSSTYLRS
jgi:hypothetical protein